MAAGIGRVTQRTDCISLQAGGQKLKSCQNKQLNWAVAQWQAIRPEHKARVKTPKQQQKWKEKQENPQVLVVDSKEHTKYYT